MILIIIYGMYLWCILRTHYVTFAEEPQKVPMRPSKHALPSSAVKVGIVKPAGLISIPGQADEQSNNEKLFQLPQEDEDNEEPEPQLHILVAVATLFTAATLLFFCTDYMVNSIGALVEDTGLSTTFVGLILLPIPNCDSAPITVAIRDMLDSTLDYTVVKSIQTALLVLPFTVLLGWWLGIEEATLVFDGFEVVSLFATIILLNLIIGKGSSIW